MMTQDLMDLVSKARSFCSLLKQYFHLFRKWYCTIINSTAALLFIPWTITTFEAVKYRRLLKRLQVALAMIVPDHDYFV